MDSQPRTIWGREPAMVLALVQAVIALVVEWTGFGLACRGVRAIATVANVEVAPSAPMFPVRGARPGAQVQGA